MNCYRVYVPVSVMASRAGYTPEGGEVLYEVGKNLQEVATRWPEARRITYVGKAAGRDTRDGLSVGGEIFRKYDVRRVDGRDLPYRDKEDAEYFVLDYVNDPIARMAMYTYARACEPTDPPLAWSLGNLLASVVGLGTQVNLPGLPFPGLTDSTEEMWGALSAHLVQNLSSPEHLEGSFFNPPRGRKEAEDAGPRPTLYDVDEAWDVSDSQAKLVDEGSPYQHWGVTSSEVAHWAFENGLEEEVAWPLGVGATRMEAIKEAIKEALRVAEVFGARGGASQKDPHGA